MERMLKEIRRNQTNMKKIIIPIVIAILFFSNSLFAQIEPIKPPQIIIWPESYVAGEETFYLEGIALPEAEIIISLEKKKESLKDGKL